MYYWIQYLPRPIPFLKRKAVIHIDIPLTDDNNKLHRLLEFPLKHGCNVSITTSCSEIHDFMFHVELDISKFNSKMTNEYIKTLEREI